MANSVNVSTRHSSRVPKDWSMIKAVRAERDYKSNVVRRDKNSRKFIEGKYGRKRKSSIFPGNFIMFDYYTPKTKEELAYYDARPATIFFNVITTKEGEKRVLGYNIHYIPPRMRWRVLERVYEIFKPYYKFSWDKPLQKEVKGFDYKLLCSQLQKAGLEFGVRMYIPELIANVRPIPVEGWSKAVLTEGVFRKDTRANILKYWRDRMEGLTLKPSQKNSTMTQIP